MPFLYNVNKLLGKIDHERCYNFLNKFSCLYKNQFFSKNHSTNHTFIEMTEKIRKALDSRKFSCGNFINLQKAFDSANHEILLKNIGHYGLCSVTNSWFKSYIDNKKQLVSFDGVDSETQVMQHGVTQGSVLEPLFFLIYNYNLHDSILYSLPYHFADDTNLLIIGSSQNKRTKTIEY